MKRTNRQEQMFSLIELQQQGQQTIVSFCKEHSITLSNFSYWLRKYRKRLQSPSAGFVAISPSYSAAPLRVLYPNGIAVELSYPDISLISALIRIG
ncbi:MAG: hypothetical protein EOP49_28710 [Sphingobacteriales bacterium]|nr:MAG: hypothetical protein EOP49_28710 [Sphingobacteriales bacterium]